MSRASTFHASTSGGGGAHGTATTGDTNASSEKTYFEMQREGLMREIGVVSLAADGALLLDCRGDEMSCYANVKIHLCFVH